jgi:drug/metabolite transporter (DMT)-like permease
MPTTNPRSLGIVALLLATSGWGGMFLVSKGVLHHVDPFWFTLSRYTIAGLVLVALLLPRGMAPWRKLRKLRKHALPLALRGLAGFGFFSVMLLIGLAHSVPSHGAVIVATAPMTTQLLRWALDGIRPARANVLTALLALAGVAVVSGVLSDGGAGVSTWHGDAVALAGTIGWILYTRGAARFAELDVVEYTALTVLASWPLLVAGALAASLLGWAHAPSLGGLKASWEALAYVGVVSSTFSVLAFNYGVRALGSVTATAFFNFVPVSALLMGIALGKPPTANELLGMAMVVAGLLIHTAITRTAPALPLLTSTMPPVRTCANTS